MAGKLPGKTASLFIVAMLLAGCFRPDAVGPLDESTNDTVSTPISGDGVQAEQEAIQFYIDKLPDRTYVETYGGDEHPRPWYTAAEALGELGKPAIPALIERLDTADSYELMLALYALMLASQDPVLLDETNGDYLQLGTVLTEESNADNRRRAREWWARHEALWRGR